MGERDRARRAARPRPPRDRDALDRRRRADACDGKCRGRGRARGARRSRGARDGGVVASAFPGVGRLLCPGELGQRTPHRMGRGPTELRHELRLVRRTGRLPGSVALLPRGRPRASRGNPREPPRALCIRPELDAGDRRGDGGNRVSGAREPLPRGRRGRTRAARALLRHARRAPAPRWGAPASDRPVRAWTSFASSTRVPSRTRPRRSRSGA